MTPDLQRLASEYRAIVAIDLILKRDDSLTREELMGLEARIRRKGEILAELARWISLAEVSARTPDDHLATHSKPASSSSQF